MSRKVKLSMSITKHHDMKSQKEVEAQLFAFLIQAIHRDERLDIHPRCFNLWERLLEPTRQEAGWDLEQVWMLQR